MFAPKLLEYRWHLPPWPVYDASQGGGFFHRKKGWVPRRKKETELEKGVS